MKNSFLIGLLGAFISVSAFAVEKNITLAWDPNKEPDLAGYTIYATRSAEIVYEARDVSEWVFDVGVMPSPQVEIVVDMNEGETVYFVATAFDTAGNESKFSNKVFFYLPKSVPLPDTSPPAVPTNLRVLSVR